MAMSDQGTVQKSGKSARVVRSAGTPNGSENNFFGASGTRACATSRFVFEGVCVADASERPAVFAC